MTDESKSMCQDAQETEEELEMRPENIPLPTDSMITVRLSDAEIHKKPSGLDEEKTESSPVASDAIESTYASTGSLVSRSSSRASSRSSETTSTSNSVDWEGLEKTEEQEVKDDATDESTALLLARLEQENHALAADPKAGMTPKSPKTETHRMSVHGLKKLVNGPQRQSLRYSLLPPPAMTELEFWAALVQDYRQTVQRLPTLTSNKIRSGVPPPLRGVVWPSIAGAHDNQLHDDFQRLSTEPSPYDGLIGKDVGRSFPNVDMFREKDGEGQQMLRRVLKAFSLYDDKIGYCQGLGFVVGPLLMHMSEPEAFAVLVRLMEHYDLRTCYTPDLAGLHLRIYQFQSLLTKHLPELSTHLAKLNVEPLYVSQWFLSFFAVTCPLPMLLRIYDIILAEGATETLMRVALSLMQRNQKKLLGFSEFEDVMQFLLSRSLWDTYAQHADDMVADFTSLTNLVSREALQSLEADFKKSQVAAVPSPLKSAAASLLGRFWAGSNHKQSKSSLSLKIPVDVVTVSTTLRKTSSGNSLTSTMTSVETTSSEASTALTELTEPSRVRSEVASIASSDTAATNSGNTSDKGLHSQIEDLLTALSKLQHQQMELARELQREREEREEERALAITMLSQLRRQREDKLADSQDMVATSTNSDLDTLLTKAAETFSPRESRRISIMQTKHQLRDAAAEWKERHDTVAVRCSNLMRRLDEREVEQNNLREELKEARQRIQDSHKDRQRLERQVHEVRRSSPVPDSPSDLYTPVSEKGEIDLKLPPPAKGLREFKLGRAETFRSSSMQYSKRTSSLISQSVVAAQNAEQTQSHESLMLELVSAKTAEAVARQELEETKSKLDALRKIISGGAISPAPRTSDSANTLSATPPATKTPEPQKPAHAPSTSIGGFFSGWGKRGT